MSDSHEHGSGRPSGPNWSRINQWVLWIGLAAAVAWLFVRHNAHLGQLLPFLILLACPLMHLFGHGGHSEHGGGLNMKPKDDERQLPPGGQGGHQH
jgi:hypothetical protein